MTLALNGSSSYFIVTALPIVNYSMFASAMSSNWVLTLGKFILGRVIFCLAQLLSKVTGKKVQLNHLFSFQMRSFLRAIGSGVGRFKSHLHRAVATKVGFSVENTPLLRTVVIGPLVEEAIHRLPLLMLATAIDAFPFGVTCISGALQITVGQVMKVALATFLSIVFVYGHEITPGPGRAASLFTNGLIYSYLTLQQPGGLMYAVVAHSVNNFLIGMHRFATTSTISRRPLLQRLK